MGGSALTLREKRQALARGRGAKRVAPAVSSVWMDSREPDILRELIQVVIPQAVTLTLDSGDYVIIDPDGIALGVERKTVGDFLNSLREKQGNGGKRLYNQLERMREAYHRVLVIIEGRVIYNPLDGTIGVDRHTTGWNHGAVQMAILGLQDRFKVQVLWTPGKEATVDVIRVLWRRAQERGLGSPEGGHEGNHERDES